MTQTYFGTRLCRFWNLDTPGTVDMSCHLKMGLEAQHDTETAVLTTTDLECGQAGRTLVGMVSKDNREENLAIWKGLKFDSLPLSLQQLGIGAFVTWPRRKSKRTFQTRSQKHFSEVDRVWLGIGPSTPPKLPGGSRKGTAAKLICPFA